ncbi:hypothetical protein, partial [Nocardia cyriacigeorgica]|uniref:hypothetical protein n=1 Tax=Nocardia cyriacigeorgica TaxID=135487 RepID=UPI001E427110
MRHVLVALDGGAHQWRATPSSGMGDALTGSSARNSADQFARRLRPGRERVEFPVWRRVFPGVSWGRPARRGLAEAVGAAGSAAGCGIGTPGGVRAPVSRRRNRSP